jgi:hypothetical protein
MEKSNVRKLILHVGAPKCGSTALQSALEIKERNGDLNNIGFTFPLEYARGSTGQGNAGPLFSYLRQRTADNLELAANFLLKQSKSVILSEEMLYWVTHKNILSQFFNQIKSEFQDIVVVTAIREPSEWLLSDYSEHIKKNILNLNFPYHVVEKERNCDWLSHFSKFTGHDNYLKVVACEHKNLFKCITEMLGANNEFLSVNKENLNLNLSLTPAQLEARRICNILEIKEPAKIKQLELIYQDFNLQEENKSLLNYIKKKNEGYVEKIKALKDVFFYEG